MSFFEITVAATKSWFALHWMMLVGIILGAYLFRKFSGLVIEGVIRRAVKGNKFSSKEGEEKRENTLIRIINGTLSVLVTVLAAMMLLSEFGVNIGPLIAAAGVAGLAFGFGGQYLIRDVITGLFLILENQYRVGDVVCFDSTCGLVEDITLRMTTLRDLDGTVHHVPHGEVKRVANLSKNFSRVNMNIGVAYESDIEQVREVVNKVGNELATDPKWKDYIIKAPQFLRIEEFADSAIIIKILGDTQPIKQWDVMGEMRLRIKIAFDKAGISIPFPQRVIHSK